MSEKCNIPKDLCRCCHSKGSYKSLHIPYFSLNVEEIYSNMLQECLGLELLPESSQDGTICDVCIRKLQAAAQFKFQVQECEMRLRKLYRIDNISVPVMKMLKHKTKTLSKVKRRVGRPRKHAVFLKNDEDVGYSTTDTRDIGYTNGTKKDISNNNNRNITGIDYSYKIYEENCQTNKIKTGIGNHSKNQIEIDFCTQNIQDINDRTKITEGIYYSCNNSEDIRFSNKNVKGNDYRDNKIVDEIVYDCNNRGEIGYNSLNMKDIVNNSNNREEIGYNGQNMQDIAHNSNKREEIGYNSQNIEDIGKMNKKFDKVGFNSENIKLIGYNSKNTEEISLNDENEYDSDTPISRFSKDISDSKEKIMNESVNSIHGLNTIKITCRAPQYKVSSAKPVSERKRIRLTCDTVLKNTTVCPFRHHRSWFRCFYCTRDFMDIDQLRQHTLETHTAEDIANIKRYPRSLQIDISDFSCTICDEILTDVKHMVEHFAQVHNKPVYKECIADYKVNTSPYTCHLCRKQYHVFRTLTTHLNEHYANYICDVCGKPFLNTKRLKVHKRTHESGIFPCTECGKVLKTKTSKANHMESHSKRILKCHLCSKPMKHYNDRIKHMSEEHNITYKFKCVICGREYNIKHYLATHMRQTHGHKNKKCAECGMAFITNHALKKHMLKHSGVKGYPCCVCGKAFARSYTLKEHMRGHDSGKVDQ